MEEITIRTNAIRGLYEKYSISVHGFVKHALLAVVPPPVLCT